MKARQRAAVLRHALRTDFRVFAEKAFAMTSGGELSDDPYIGVICKAAVDVFDGTVPRLVLNLPPRHGKTLIFTVSLCAWELGHRPRATIMVLSYDRDLARLIADKVRDVLRAAWFKRTFRTTRLRPGHNRAMDFATTKGGALFANQMRSGVTGHGADLIIIDDPSDIADADSVDKLAKINDAFDHVVNNRLNNPTGRIVVVGHRIHAQDLSGHVCQDGDWRHIKLSLVSDGDESYVTDSGTWHRNAGDVLRGDFTTAQVGKLRRSKNFRALYQQAPEGEATWVIVPDDFQTFAALPPGIGGTVLSIDTGHVPGAGRSYSVILVWRSAGDQHYLIDQFRERVSPNDLEDATLRFIRHHRASVVLIENASAGIGLTAGLQRRERRAGYVVVPITTDNRTKFSRFAEVVPIIKQRAVHLPLGTPWRPAYVAELTEFPRGSYDDQVDATAQYLAWSRDHGEVPGQSPRPLGAMVTEGGRRMMAGQSDQPPGLVRRNVFSRRR